ncbi:hypothetical protein, partial [Escherichia coli]|uniref:hypothetical protein n=1 Tax=Escherichia coli TaxID=562 RepID=UPI002FBEBB14
FATGRVRMDAVAWFVFFGVWLLLGGATAGSPETQCRGVCGGGGDKKKKKKKKFIKKYKTKTNHKRLKRMNKIKNKKKKKKKKKIKKKKIKKEK